jgi:hypothetical protein
VGHSRHHGTVSGGLQNVQDGILRRRIIGIVGMEKKPGLTAGLQFSSASWRALAPITQAHHEALAVTGGCPSHYKKFR